MMVKRTEQMHLDGNQELGSLCHLSKNLYNEANYIVRQEFFDSGDWIRYNELAETMKYSENYQKLPAQTAQQTLKLLDRNWKSFFNSMKEWKRHPERFYSRPSPPSYKNKAGEFVLIFTTQQARLEDGLMVLPRMLQEVIGKIETRLDGEKHNLREVRIVPKPVGYSLQVVYEMEITVPDRDESRVAGIDLGVRNLVTVANNIGIEPIVVKGGAAKSINQYYNKERARLKSIYDRQGIEDGQAFRHLRQKYRDKMHDYLHKVSRRIVDYLVEHDIGTLIIGQNKNWKQRVNIGKRNNQSFVGIPHHKLIHMLRYKAEEQDIEVVLQEESHTSVCSFFDDESVEHHDDYAGKRKRGLYRTAKGHVVNADVNGALNIIKKAVPKAFSRENEDGIEGVVGHPARMVVK